MADRVQSMYHFMIDGFQGYRSRFDQFALIKELLEEIPVQLGLQPVMPAFLLPYYDGVVPQDCGISAFLFVSGGHFTIHTFSFREAFFADLVSYQCFDEGLAEKFIRNALPCKTNHSYATNRDEHNHTLQAYAHKTDFGPHLLMKLSDYTGPEDLDTLFVLFDTLPRLINMTPIMRPYVIKGKDDRAGAYTSVMTMIAESHLAIHVFLDLKIAYIDLFSCSYFNYEVVKNKLLEVFTAQEESTTLIARGKGYQQMRTDPKSELSKTTSWLWAIN